MPIELRKPELARYVAEKVHTGEFPDEQSVIEDALWRMKEEEEQAETLTDEDVREIEQAEREFERGEYVDFDVFAAEMKKKYQID